MPRIAAANWESPHVVPAKPLKMPPPFDTAGVVADLGGPVRVSKFLNVSKQTPSLWARMGMPRCWAMLLYKVAPGAFHANPPRADRPGMVPERSRRTKAEIAAANRG